MFYYFRRKDTRGKCSSEYCRELIVEASDAHLVKVPVWVDDRLKCLLSAHTTFFVFKTKKLSLIIMIL